ncbi:uncharacterized protein [Rutidosis leptorrhynchoides]|uniref:uncharacterized protein n=1 Tax=Rutidosis leptorrhynchoides TaxID=125765 RepID=UPI003A9A3AB2
MKTRNFRGLAYKQHLWKCATATTVAHFEKFMADLKAFDAKAHKYLSDIPPRQWSRSHFSGRAVSDVLLSNMCEVFNRWIVDGRDKPIITCLEFIRTYLMKRIDSTQKNIMKSDGVLTPKATKVFELIKKEASKYSVIYNGSRMFQVTGPNNEQLVVDMGQESCACRKWEVTGMPCKHFIACIWNMRANDPKVPRPELWVNQVHHRKRWFDTYQHAIIPLNGRDMWPKSNVTIPILPPKKIATAGRPKKSRRKGLLENDNIVEGGKLSKKGQVIKCGICKGAGHNRRGCPTRGGAEAGQSSGTKRKSMEI